MTISPWNFTRLSFFLLILSPLQLASLGSFDSASAFAQAPLPTTEQVQALIKEMGQKAVLILTNSDETSAQRAAEFGEILDTYFDLGEIGRFLVGKDYFEKLSASEKATYLETLRTYIVQLYLGKFEEYQTTTLSKDAFRIVRAFQRNSQDPKSGFSVLSTIDVWKADTQEPISLKLDWRVFDTPRGYKIQDVYVSDLSMSQTKREEFRGIIKKGGLALLLAELKTKTDDFIASSNASDGSNDRDLDEGNDEGNEAENL